MRLHKYWFKFRLTIADPHPIGTLMGCGVTASSKEDALQLLRERVFRSLSLPSIDKCLEDVVMSDLDAKHVVPNVGDSSRIGVWFPLGYDSEPDEPQASGT